MPARITASVASASCRSSTWESFIICAPRMIGAIAPANLLAIPIMLIRLAALSRGPMIVTYGFEAVWRRAIPVPWTKRPRRKMA